MSTLPFLGVLAYPNIDPIAVQLGPLAIRWYGLAYVAGILCGWLSGRYLAGNAKLWPGAVSPISKDDVDDYILWITGGIVIGGRLGSIIFYDFDTWLSDPVSLFRVWEGGMSFHGGLIGVVIATLLFARQRKVPLWSFGDMVAASVPFGLFFGRLANFVNAELYGAPSNVAWAMVFPGAGPEPRHPSQLYQAGLEGIALFVILYLAIHRFDALHRPRLTIGLFLVFYAAARIFSEFFRLPDAHIGYLLDTSWLTMGMVLSVPMAVLGALCIASAKPRAAPPSPSALAQQKAAAA